MAINLDYPPGATPLDADELASLIPSHITTQGELNEWEQLNILQGEAWARKQRKEILDEAFLRLCTSKCSAKPGAGRESSASLTRTSASIG